MREATAEILRELGQRADDMKQRIRAARDEIEVPGANYYVAADGDDANDGQSPARPWKTTARVSSARLCPGDAVRFRRGDVFRGPIICRPGVTYAAWGEGPKPAVHGWERGLSDPALWACVDAARHIYRLRDALPDCGTLVFDGGVRHSRKLIPSFVGGRFVCRDEPDRPFVMADEMREDLDLFCDCRSVMTNIPSHGQTWPVPHMCAENRGALYLRCDEGNPGEVFESIEALPGRHTLLVGSADHVHIDNLCLKYCGAHAISAGGPCVRDLRVTNCEIGWVGGTIQHYLGTDPNYPEGTRGSVTRFGNGIEIYGGCDGYLCANNYIYQVYDAGITHQYTVSEGETCAMRNIRYTGNLIENCSYSIEYFLSCTAGSDSLMENVEIDHSLMRFSGYGWGRQRHNFWTPAHIKSWLFENPARQFSVHDNVFDRAKYLLLQLCCGSEEDCPEVRHNVYVQSLGRALGQFGAVETCPPPVLAFFETSDADIERVVGDGLASAYYVDAD